MNVNKLPMASFLMTGNGVLFCTFSKEKSLTSAVSDHEVLLFHFYLFLLFLFINTPLIKFNEFFELIFGNTRVHCLLY